MKPDIVLIHFISQCVWGLCNIGYPSETHIELKSREISFAHNLSISYPTVLEFHTEHGSIIAVLCAESQIDWTTETYVLDERVFARFEFNMGFGQISYITQGTLTIYE